MTYHLQHQLQGMFYLLYLTLMLSQTAVCPVELQGHLSHSGSDPDD